jgi:hypothetical protein
MFKIVKHIKDFNPKIIAWLTVIIVTWVNFNITFWQNKNVIRDDVNSYYNYLPSVFYYEDISQGFLNDTVNKRIEDRYFWPEKTPDGKYVFKTSMGMSLTYLPFFIGAHYFAKTFHYDLSGYSEPYQFAIQFSSLFYFVTGLLFLIRILRLNFSNSIVFFVLFCITFGTNALYYLTIGGGMPHAVNFALMAAFIYYTIKWHDKPGYKCSFLIGLTGGLLTLIRPINILVFVLFFIHDIKSKPELLQKIKLLFENKLKLILIALLGILIFFPQLAYWKYQTGSWFYNSYVGERFYFNNSHVLYGLFSFRKGWLVYTPLMAFALIGIFCLYRSLKEFFYPVIILLVIYIYLVFSWWCWWYGGSYGQRALIDIYPVLAIPFAALLNQVQKSDSLKKGIVYSLMAAIILLNIFQTMQAKWNTIHFDSMTKGAYFDAFLRLTKNPEREKFLKHPDYRKAREGIDEY